MKQTLFYVLVTFAFCTCRRTPDSSFAIPRQQVFFLSPVTLIEMKTAETEKKAEIENIMAETEKKAVGEDTRCSIYDNECQKNFFQEIAVKFAPTGIPELGIPVLDPYRVTNVSLSILGLLDLTLIEGVAIGIGKCVVTKFVTNVERRYREPNIVCKQIVIKGRYKLSSASDASSAMGDKSSWYDVHGEGNLNIVLENWTFRFRYPFKIVRRTDGEIYLNGLFDNAVYETAVQKVTLDADSVMIGKHDITKHVVSFINSHWKLIMRSDVGKFIYDKSAQYYYDVYRTFFDKSPANTYLRDDLTPLIEH